MKDEQGLDRLIKLARRGRATQPHHAPFGFATRMAARGVALREPDTLALLERFGRWAVAAALVACLLTTGMHQRTGQHSAFAEFAGLNEPAEGLWK